MVVGAAVGLLASWATSLFDDHLIEIALTAIAAYGAFLLAERIHVSGVLATVLAGLFVGNIGKKRGMSPHTRVAVLSFWEYMAFFINSVVFLLLGLEVTLPKLWDNLGFILMAFVAVLLGRGLVVFGAMPLHRRRVSFYDARVATILWWGGLRGSLSIVLVLALPHSIASRDTLIAMTFGVVVLSVILQGATMRWLLERLGLVPTRSAAMRELALILARLRAIDAQREAIDELVHEGAKNLPGLAALERDLELKKAGLVAELNARRDDPDFAQAATDHAASVHQHIQEVARDAIREAMDDNLLDEELAAELLAEMEERPLAQGPVEVAEKTES
jgi:CPA1 family monovalent cation:H+ antiporter